jgi:rhodanese-related sulfurtransferase
MKRQIYAFAVMTAFLVLTAFTAARADPPEKLVPITADEAFDAVAMQVDPASGDLAEVYLIDVRDPYEVYMNGGPAAVEEIRLWGDEEGHGIIPDDGRVRLVQEGKFVEYHVNGRYRRELVRDIEGMATFPLATNIPLWRLKLEPDPDAGWKATFDRNTADYFSDTVADQGYPADAALIVFCRTGGRSSQAGALLLAYAQTNKIDWTLYEIDDPGGEPSHGGFSGPAYGGALAGYDGFPGRFTDRARVPSASWVDAGLPVVRASTEIILPSQE